MSRPYKQFNFDNSRDNELLIIHTKSVKPNYDFSEQQQQQNKEITDNDIYEKMDKRDPKTISIDWSPIIGYDKIKFVITRALRNKNKKKVHILIVGSAGTSKTIFLKTIETSLKQQGFNVHYLDATTLSSSGVIEYIFTHDIEFLLLDELDKLEREHQNTFLNLLESGIIQETKHKKIRKKECPNMIILATGNYMEKILNPLITRFLLFEIPKYTKDQFFAISKELLKSQYAKTPEIANYITSQVWDIYMTKKHEEPNMRTCRDIAILTDNDKTEIDHVLDGIAKYSLKVDVEK